MFSSAALLLVAVAAPLLLTSADVFKAIVNTNIQGGNAGIAYNEEFDALTYLERAGYLDDLHTTKHQHHAPDSVKQALREFQQFVGLPVTGRVDTPTISMMKTPRCGVPDVIKPSQRHKNETDANAPENFKLYTSEWHNYDITYKWVSYTNKLGRDEQRRIVADAFQKWSRVCPLNFRETTGPADIDLSFVTRKHSGCNTPFDGRGGTLAHAFGPGYAPIAGDVHFDADEEWVPRENMGGFLLGHVATHEIGHALGLAHSDDENAVMFPVYNGLNQLGDDDIKGIQKKYGPRRDGPTTENDCNLRFDDIVRGTKGGIYVFRGQYYYAATHNGLSMKRRISEMYPGAPDNPDAVINDRIGGYFYMFKGQYYYRFVNYKLSPGFPKVLGRDFQNIDGGIMRFDRELYLFKGNQITRWVDGMQHYPRGFPKSIKSFYGGNAPDRVDAAFEFDNKITFLFNNDRYWKYIVYKQKEQASPGYPKSIKPFWLHCGFVPGRDEEPVFGYVG